jgi:hypothetical protein
MAVYSEEEKHFSPVFSPWVSMEDHEEYRPTPLTSPLETPMNGVLNPSLIFSEGFGRTLVVQNSHPIPASVPPSTQHEHTFSPNGSWAYDRQAHGSSDLGSWNHVHPAGDSFEQSSTSMALSQENQNSIRRIISMASTVPNGRSHTLGGQFSLEKTTGSTSAGQVMLPDWNNSTERARRQGNIATLTSVSGTDQIDQKDFQSTDSTVIRSPGLRTITPIQVVHQLVCEESGEAATGSVSNRIAHNIVEKQYRIRLNKHFEKLLESIPADLVRSGLSSARRADGSERKVSKCEVLRLARTRIEELEEEIKRLRGLNPMAEED